MTRFRRLARWLVAALTDRTYEDRRDAEVLRVFGPRLFLQ
jgi:hypothetical protein